MSIKRAFRRILFVLHNASMNLQSFSFPPFSCPLSLSAGLFVCLLPLHSVYISVRSKTTHLFFKQRTTCLVFLICTDQNCSISSNRQHSLHFITVTYEIRIIYCLSSSFFVSLSLSLSFSLSLTLSLSLSLSRCDSTSCVLQPRSARTICICATFSSISFLFFVSRLLNLCLST
jgi:hypothetical protein